MKKIKVLEIPEVRVSTAGFAVVNDGDRYALTFNPKRPNKVLTPLGGGLEATDSGIDELKTILNISDDAFEEGNGLRFSMRGSTAEKYRDWFILGENRDTNPQREVFEELVEELGLLESSDLEGATFEKLGYGTELSEGTQRIGADGTKPTLRIIEVFDMKLKSETLEKLTEISKEKDSPLRFVTKEDIQKGVTNDGIKISTNVARFLFEFESEIPEFE